jgi:hypothetical protein
MRSAHGNLRKRMKGGPMRRFVPITLVLTTLFAWTAVRITAADEQASKASPGYTEHDDLSYYLRDDGTRAEIRTRDDWRPRRRHILEGMQQVMGSLPQPEKPVPLNMKVLEEHRDERVVRR